MENNNLNFGNRASALQNIKWINSERFRSKLFNINHNISDGDNPAESAEIGKFIPVRTTLNKGEGNYGEKIGIVSHHGTIVSANTLYLDSFYSSGADAATGIQTSGDINISKDILGNPIKTKAQDAGDGYGRGITSLLTVANGGVDSVDKYGQTDVDLGAYKADGTLAAVGDDWNRSKNIPVGIAFKTIFRDDAGAVHGYTSKTVKLESIQTDHFIKIPTIIVDRAKTALNVTGAPADVEAFTNGLNGVNNGGHATYRELLKLMTFGYMDTADLIYGGFLKPDKCGMFTNQYDVDSAYTGQKTVQTVGKMFSFDTKYPKDQMDLDINYSTSNVTGSSTFGIDSAIFMLGYQYVRNSGVSEEGTIWQKVIDLVNAGAIGFLKINLHTS